jgi:protein TonB
VPFAVIENVPVFPGCEKGNNDAKKKCMSEQIAKFVNKKFNTDLASDLGLSGRQRINVIFKIDKTGNIVGIRARAPHPGLEREATRVIGLLPKMKPGKQRGKAVTVPYSLPNCFSSSRLSTCFKQKKFKIKSRYIYL